MILAEIYKSNSVNEKANGKFYGRPLSLETVDLAGLAEHMSSHNSPFSAGVIKGLMTDMVFCIKELLLEGKNVKLDNLAIFSVGFITNGGSDSYDGWTVSQNIKGLKLRARATGELSHAQLNLEGVVRRADSFVSSAASSDSSSGGSSGEDELV